jgi:hypothetical protein
MHYISATRRKSCTACVKSKRRCDLEYPSCRRCLLKGLDCTYTTASSVRDKKSVRQSLADSPPQKASVVDSSAEFLLFNGASTDPLGDISIPFCASGASSGSSPDSWQDELELSASLLLNNIPFEEPQLCRPLWPDIAAPSYLNDGQTQYILRALRAYVPSMAYTGSTPFLHQSLWHRYQPESYQDCVSISALYLCKTSGNTSLITNSINTKIGYLIAASNNWGIVEHLAAVQTLIIYQIIRLFDPSLNEQVAAQKHNALLETWATALWKRSFNEPIFLANCYETWVFNESLRRTVMISVFVCCAWSIHTRDGLADKVPVLARIPFTENLRAWKSDPDDWNSSVLPEILEKDSLVAYADFTEKWAHEKDVVTLDSFGKLLLAACRGGDDPRLLL